MTVRVLNPGVGRREGPVRTKVEDLFSGRVTYTMSRYELARAVAQWPVLVKLTGPGQLPANDRVTHSMLPPVDIYLAVDVHRRDFLTQFDRRKVAGMLRQLRALYRQQLQEEGL